MVGCNLQRLWSDCEREQSHHDAVGVPPSKFQTGFRVSKGDHGVQCALSLPDAAILMVALNRFPDAIGRAGVHKLAIEDRITLEVE